MELAADKPRMILKFHDFDQISIRRQATENHSLRLKNFPVAVVHFKPVAMSFGDLRGPVDAACQGLGLYDAGISPKSHCPALFTYILLRFHYVYNGVFRTSVILGRIRVIYAAYVS